ncbi:MAG: HPr family phosphocarrier protein [Pseudomonadota bacterium]
MAQSQGVVRQKVTIVNEKGLHARAAAKFVKLADRFDAEIWVVKSDMTVGGSSIMGLMMLAAAKGSKIEISARGGDAVAAVDALCNLVSHSFGEG